jgi:hypothetical protein
METPAMAWPLSCATRGLEQVNSLPDPASANADKINAINSISGANPKLAAFFAGVFAG